MKYDVVYILKNNYTSKEIVYSLRSLVNFPYRSVWFAGGCPKGIEPDGMLEMAQLGRTKWERVIYTLRKVCECKEISKSFWLFNDDFFILKPVEEKPASRIKTQYNGDLLKRVHSIGRSEYALQLARTACELKRRGLGVKNYAVHVPMLINKDKALEVLDTFKGFPMFRSLYGNYWKVGGVDMPDVKIKSNNALPPGDAQMVSTSNETFARGKVGEYLRGMFPEPSEWEIQNNGTRIR